MRSYILPVLLVVLLFGCRQQDMNVPGLQSSDLLEFNTQTKQPNDRFTRAYSGDVMIENSGFTTIGYMTTGIFSLSDGTNLPTPNVFNFEDLSKSPLKTITRNASGKYQVELPKITHADGTNLSFFAWSQAAGSGGITSTTSASTEQGYPWMDVTVALPNTTQRDVVGANTMNLSNEYVISSVDLDFKHLLSKLTFKINAPTEATVTIVSTQCSFGANKVYQKGRFTFNDTDTVGTWGNHNTYLGTTELTPSGWSAPKLSLGNTALLGEMLVLPQQVDDGFLTLKVKYTLTMGGVTSAEQTRTLSLKAANLLQGRNYVYTLSVNADQMSLFNVSIAPWIEGDTGSLPLVPGPKGDIVLLLDGNEEPYTHTDGKQYWLDASGWNNHCLIDNSASSTNKVTYNESNKGYVFHAQATGANLSIYNVVRVPNLGTMGGTISCEIIANLDADAPYTYPIPLYFSSDKLDNTIQNKTRGFNFECHGDHITFGYGGTAPNWDSSQQHSFPLYADRTRRTFYAFTRSSSGRQTITYNDQYHNTEYPADSKNNNAVYSNGVIGNLWKGTINYIKITKNQLSQSQLKTDYDELKTKFGISPDANFVSPPAITRGLVLCLDGRSSPISGSYSEKEWKDISGQNHNATIYNPRGGISKSGTRYVINNGGSIGQDYIFTRDLGNLSSAYTVEFAAEEIRKDVAQATLFQFTSSPGNGHRDFFVHYPYDEQIFIDSPYDTPNETRFSMPCHSSTLNIYQTGGEHLSVTRAQGGYMYVYKGGAYLGSAGTTHPIQSFTACYIGTNSSRNAGVCVGLYFVRVYNRVLSDAERKMNLVEDRRVHGVTVWD